MSQITLISSKIMIHTHINTHYTYIKGENNSIEIRGGCRNPCNWRHNTKKFQIHIELGELFPFIQQKLRTSNQIYLNYIRISETSRGHVTPYRQASVRSWLRYFLLTNMIFFRWLVISIEISKDSLWLLKVWIESPEFSRVSNKL